MRPPAAPGPPPGSARGPRQRWLELALRGDVVRRSTRVALVVGSLLVAINYADRIASGAIGPRELFKMALTYCVPYCVATYAAVEALRAR